MEPADSIARLGFTRWYERQLMQGHAYLVTCFLCIVVVASCFEVVGARAGRVEHVLAAVVIVGSGMLGAYSLRRYRAILLRAEAFARCATCESCETYGRIRVVEAGSTAAEAPEAPREQWMKVQCRKCGHGWTMS